MRAFAVLLLAVSLHARGLFFSGGVTGEALMTRSGEYPFGMQGGIRYGVTAGFSFGSIAVFAVADEFATLPSFPVEEIIYRARKGISIAAGAGIALVSSHDAHAWTAEFGARVYAAGTFDNYRMTSLYQCSLGGGIAPYADIALSAFPFSLQVSVPFTLFMYGASAVLSCGLRIELLWYPFAPCSSACGPA